MPAATPFLQVANRASSVTAGAVDGVSDPVVVNLNPGDGALFPTFPGNPFHITIDDEILECTNRVVDALTCTRAQEGTVIAAHGGGVAVQLRVTAQILSDLDTAVNNCETVGAFTNEAEGITAKWTWTLAAGVHIARRIAGDVADRSYWTEDRIAWGTGAAGADTEIGRGGANLLSTPDDLQLGVGPATTGIIRLPNAQYIYARNAAGAANYLILGLDGANNIAMQAPIKHELAAGSVAFRAYVFGEANPRTTIEHGQIQFGAGGASALDTIIARTAAAVVRITTSLEVGGATPATAGAIRLPNATYVEARDAGNAADVILIGLDGSDNALMRAPIAHYLAAGSVILRGYVFGEANPKTTIEHGRIQFGAGGAAALDVNLYRSAANVLKTDDAFHINNAAGLLVNNIEPYSGDRVAFGATADRLGIPVFAGDPGAVVDSDLWYNSVIPALRARINGVTLTIGAGSTPGPSLSSSHLFEEFMGGLPSTSGQIGELGWLAYVSGAGSLTQRVSGIAGHPGIQELVAGAGTASYAVLALQGTTVAAFDPVNYFDGTFVFRVAGTILNSTYRIGVYNYPTTNPPESGAYVEKKAADANFFLVTRSGWVDRTRTDTGVPVDLVWHKVRVRRVDGATFGLTFDGGAEILHNVSLPTGTLEQVWQVFGSTGATAVLQADVMDWYVNSLAR